MNLETCVGDVIRETHAAGRPGRMHRRRGRSWSLSARKRCGDLRNEVRCTALFRDYKDENDEAVRRQGAGSDWTTECLPSRPG